MRIAVVGPTYPYRGGIAHYTTLLVYHLRAAGHTTRFYSFTRQYPRWLFPGKTDRDPSTAALRVECEYVLDPVNPLTWWRLCHNLRRDDPEVVLLQWWVPYWTPSMTVIGRWLKRNTRSKIVFVCHNVLPHEGGGFLDRRLAMTVLRSGDAFIVHSEQDKHYLRALLPDAAIYKAHLPTYEPIAQLTGDRGSDPYADDRAVLGVPANRPVVLFFGFVRPYKGLEYLVQALPLVLREQPVHLLVVGEFWTAPEFYERYAAQFGVQNAMTLVNRYVPNEELHTYFNLAEVVVLPYVSATQSAVAQLAFGAGKAVITTRVGGLPEIVQDGVTGLIVPPQDSAALAAAIVRFIREGLRVPFERNVQAANTARTYGWQHLVATLEAIHHDLLPSGVAP